MDREDLNWGTSQRSNGSGACMEVASTARVAAVFPAVLMAVFMLAGTVRAVPATRPAPRPPSGYHETYSHNFATQGRGNWVTQPQARATVSTGKYGLSITVTGKDQWAEVHSGVVIKPNSFVQAQVYLPSADGKIVNWPAFWAVGSVWPADGEIDIIEGLAGRACWRTHYAGIGRPGLGSCAPAGKFTGWSTMSALWTGGKVTFWYNNTRMGTVTLPTTADQKLIFENQSFDPSNSCPVCYGPLAYPSTAYLSWVHVWEK
jgi:hypothetical protein